MGPGYRLEGFFLLFAPRWRINKQHLQRAFVRKFTTCRYYHEITSSACFVFVVNFKNAATFNDVVNKIGLALAYRRYVAVVCFIGTNSALLLISILGNILPLITTLSNELAKGS